MRSKSTLEFLNPSGYCLCGCGQPTGLIRKSHARVGLIAGDHYRYVKGHGTRKSPVDYIEEDQGYTTPCWIWQRGIGKRWGYATNHPRNGESARAHIAYWERVNGPVPDGMLLDHLCRIRHCVNPAHLEPVSQAVNVQRGDLTKLTADDVRQIRRLAETMIHRDIAAMYGVCRENIGAIVRRKSWKNVA